MSECPRCTGKDGAHYMECVVGRLFERLMGADYPWKAPVAPVPEITRRQTGALVPPDVEAEHQARRASLIEAAAPVPRHPGPRGYERSEPLGPPIESITGPRELDEAQADEEEPEAPAVVPQPAKTEPGKWAPNPDAQAAIDLFVSENLEPGKPRDYVAAPIIAEAYEKWRHTIDGPKLDPNTLSRGLTRAGLSHRSQANPSQAKKLPGGRRAILYFGWKFKGAEQAPAVAAPGRWAEWADDVHHHVKRFMDDCLILGENGYNGQSWMERRDWVPGYALTEAYNKWRVKHAPEAPELAQRDVSMGLRGNGYSGRQAHRIGGTKPMLYFGLILRPEINWGQPRASETAAADDKEDHAEVIRSLMKAAKKAARPAPAPAPAAPKPNLLVALQMEQDKADNNGWFKAPAASNGATAPTLTIEDIEAENAAVTTKKRSLYTGKRPGQEIPKEYRELVSQLLEVPGWRYEPHNARGKGKPRVYNPKGQMLCLPNTPSDVKSLMATKTMLKNSLGAPL